MEALHASFRSQPCFVCEVVSGTNDLPQHFVYEDDEIVAFLDAFPKAYGYTLVAPRKHREQVTKDFTREEYLRVQAVVYGVTEAVREEVGAERMYVYAFGSNEGNAHVHWHVVPLPPGVPYEEQQGAWASWDKGVLEISRQEMADLAGRIGRRM
ncbi:HIT family protein [Rubrobacter tropicus]|nr:HIT domain-containing protein [Rubrobacter tropicus]